jgi:hypothetical protein
MERTAWIIVATLSLGTAAGCKDSNPNYIGFDAQPGDVRGDVVAAVDVPPADGAADGARGDASANDATTLEVNGADASATEVGAIDAASDGNARGDAGEDAEGDAEGDAGGADASSPTSADGADVVDAESGQ